MRAIAIVVSLLVVLVPPAWWLQEAESRSGSGERRVVRWELRRGGRWSVPVSRRTAVRWAQRRALRGRAGLVRARRLRLIWGEASWYGEAFRGRTTACGNVFNPDRLTAAHPSLPCGSRVLVRGNGRRVRVTITDRGPYAGGRVLDLSEAAFRRLASPSRGTLHVHALVVGR